VPRRVRRLLDTSSIALAGLAAGAVLIFIVPSAAADRRPTKREASAIKRVALKACRPAPGCDFRRARVSTPNARFAWASVVGEGFSGALLKRPTKRSRRFRVVGTQGGGIATCAYWRARAPRRVLRDLHVRGLVDDSGAAVSCG
jgi:hypothetical protein